ncbi:MAG: hypothetical protein AAF194_02475 [Pseudomonadota bacterium]
MAVKDAPPVPQAKADNVAGGGLSEGGSVGGGSGVGAGLTGGAEGGLEGGVGGVETGGAGTGLAAEPEPPPPQPLITPVTPVNKNTAKNAARRLDAVP